MVRPYPGACMIILQHAIDKYRERTGDKSSDDRIEEKIHLHFKTSKEVYLKPQYRAAAIINHNFKKANYFRSHQFILVVVDGYLKTIHLGDAKRWEDN